MQSDSAAGRRRAGASPPKRSERIAETEACDVEAPVLGTTRECRRAIGAVLKRGHDAPMLVESITQIGAEVIKLAAPQSGGVAVVMILEGSVVNEPAENHLPEESVEIHGPEQVRVSIARLAD